MSQFGVFGKLPRIGGTGQRNWEKNVDRIKAMKIVETLNSMKNVSKTGATGFGPLSEGELKILTDASTALDKDLSAKDAERYMKKIEKISNKILGRDKPGAITAEKLGLDPKKFEVVY
jgi:hypothetical protein